MDGTNFPSVVLFVELLIGNCIFSYPKYYLRFDYWQNQLRDYKLCERRTVTNAKSVALVCGRRFHFDCKRGYGCDVTAKQINLAMLFSISKHKSYTYSHNGSCMLTVFCKNRLWQLFFSLTFSLSLIVRDVASFKETKKKSSWLKFEHFRLKLERYYSPDQALSIRPFKYLILLKRKYVEVLLLVGWLSSSLHLIRWCYS